MWEVRQVESGSQRNREGNRGTGRGGRGKPPGAGAGGGGLSMETVFGSATGITHGGPCAHVRAPRAMSAHTLHGAHAMLAHLRSHLIIDVTPWRGWGPWSLSREEGEGQVSRRTSRAPLYPLQPQSPTGPEAQSNTRHPSNQCFLCPSLG